MKTRIRMYFVGDNKISRTEKKHIKEDVRNRILDIYKKKRSIDDLTKILINPQRTSIGKGSAIYSEIETTKEIIDLFFPKKISKQTNYLLGTLQSIKKNVLYLMDVDDLFFMSGEYYIWPSDEKKTMFIKIH